MVGSAAVEDQMFADSHNPGTAEVVDTVTRSDQAQAQPPVAAAVNRRVPVAVGDLAVGVAVGVVGIGHQVAAEGRC